MNFDLQMDCLENIPLVALYVSIAQGRNFVE